VLPARIVAQGDCAFAADLGARVAHQLFCIRNHVELQLARDAQCRDADIGVAVFERRLDVALTADWDAGQQLQRARAHPRVIALPELQQLLFRAALRRVDLHCVEFRPSKIAGCLVRGLQSLYASCRRFQI